MSTTAGSPGLLTFGVANCVGLRGLADQVGHVDRDEH